MAASSPTLAVSLGGVEVEGFVQRHRNNALKPSLVHRTFLPSPSLLGLQRRGTFGATSRQAFKTVKKKRPCRGATRAASSSPPSDSDASSKSEDSGDLGLDDDRLNLKFGRLLGEDPRDIKAKILLSKVKPNLSLLDAERLIERKGRENVKQEAQVASRTVEYTKHSENDTSALPPVASSSSSPSLAKPPLRPKQGRQDDNVNEFSINYASAKRSGSSAVPTLKAGGGRLVQEKERGGETACPTVPSPLSPVSPLSFRKPLSSIATSSSSSLPPKFAEVQVVEPMKALRKRTIGGNDSEIKNLRSADVATLDRLVQRPSPFTVREGVLSDQEGKREEGGLPGEVRRDEGEGRKGRKEKSEELKESGADAPSLFLSSTPPFSSPSFSPPSPPPFSLDASKRAPDSRGSLSASPSPLFSRPSVPISPGFSRPAPSTAPPSPIPSKGTRPSLSPPLARSPSPPPSPSISLPIKSTTSPSLARSLPPPPPPSPPLSPPSASSPSLPLSPAPTPPLSPSPSPSPASPLRSDERAVGLETTQEPLKERMREGERIKEKDENSGETEIAEGFPREILREEKGGEMRESPSLALEDGEKQKEGDLSSTRLPPEDLSSSPSLSSPPFIPGGVLLRRPPHAAPPVSAEDPLSPSLSPSLDPTLSTPDPPPNLDPRPDWLEAAAMKEREMVVSVRATGSNNGGLLIRFKLLSGFLPSSMLSDERRFPSFEKWGIYFQGLLEGERERDGGRRRENGKETRRDEDQSHGEEEIVSEGELRDLYETEKRKSLDALVGQKFEVIFKYVSQRDKRLVVSERDAAPTSRPILKRFASPSVPQKRETESSFGTLREQKGGAEGERERGQDLEGGSEGATKRGESVQLEDWKKKKLEVMSTLRVGVVVKCSVVKFSPYGVFVKCFGVDAIIHNSELSWNRRERAEEVVSPGQDLLVKVCYLDYQRLRIGLSLRQMTPDPLLLSLESLLEVGEKGEGGGESLPYAEFIARSDAPETSSVSGEGKDVLSQEVDRLLAKLRAAKGVERVNVGRRVRGFAMAPSMQFYLSSQLEDGYKLVVRTGAEVQEVQLFTGLDRDEVKKLVLESISSVEGSFASPSS